MHGMSAYKFVAFCAKEPSAERKKSVLTPLFLAPSVFKNNKKGRWILTTNVSDLYIIPYTINYEKNVVAVIAIYAISIHVIRDVCYIEAVYAWKRKSTAQKKNQPSHKD